MQNMTFSHQSILRRMRHPLNGENVETVQVILGLMQSLSQNPQTKIEKDSRIFADVDMDSLRWLEFVDSVRAIYAVDLLNLPELLVVDPTVEMLSLEIDKMRKTA
jgi:hypothetical protein